MNITPHSSNIPIATVVNPQTDNLRRENSQRELISQPAAASQSAAEKGVASDKDRGKTNAQQNEHIDFANIRKRAEKDNATINDSKQGDGDSSQGDNQQAKQNQLQAFAEEQEISELKLRDQQVRSHELAHASVGGAFTGAPSYEFETGPDGKKYAVSGEVSVDLSVVDGNPRATIAKMQKVHAAALAPADPSVHDTRVAANAARIIAQAQSELLAAGQEVVTLARENSEVGKANDAPPSPQDNPRSKISDFDSLINHTLKAQERVQPTISQDVKARAVRIETFYLNINQAYEKPPSYNFQLTA